MKHSTTLTGDTSAVLHQAREQLDLGRPEDALDILNESRQHSPLIENARGVCLLRIGEYNEALLIFRSLVFPKGAFDIPEDTPVAFRVNYITTLLLLDNVIVGLQLLHDLPRKKHPFVRQLTETVKRWKRSLPWWRRLLLPAGVYPNVPLRPECPLGSMWIPDEQG